MSVEHQFAAFVVSSLIIQFTTFIICGCTNLRVWRIERNTRPPKPDLKSFINRNTKGD